MTAYSTRSTNSIWLVGATNESFQASKLPSIGDTLKVLFYYHTDKKMSLKDSIDKCVLLLLLPIWEMARIPTKAQNHVIEHVRKLHSEWQSLKKNINRSSETNLSNHSSQSSSSDEELKVGPSIPKARKTQTQAARDNVDVVTPQVAAALDRTNISDRKAAHIFSAMASTGLLKPDVEELVISPSAIRRARIKHRKLFSLEIKESFDPAVPLILHWDGKIMDDLTGPERGKVDRLPILISGQDVVKLLSVPKLQDGTAASMAQAITETIDDWGLQDAIKGLCFDTTYSNTGTKVARVGYSVGSRAGSTVNQFGLSSPYLRNHSRKGFLHS